MPILAPQAHDWIHTACRRFCQATGHPLVFTPTHPDEVEEVERRLSSDETRPWFEPVRIADDETIGFLHIEPTGDEELLAATEMAEVVGELITRLATACTDLESRSRELSTLVEIGRSVPVEMDTAGALRQLLKAVVELTGFRSVAFFLLDAKTESLRLRMVEQQEEYLVPHPERRLAESPADLEALVRGEMLVNGHETPAAAQWLPNGVTLGWCAAVQSEAGPVGTLWAFDRRSRRPTRRESHVLQSIVSQFSGVLERAVLRVESATQLRLRRELESVADTGREFVPAFTSDSVLEVAGVCTSRYEVGGDMCDVLPLDEHRTIVAVGDASGDSVPAALVMSSLRGALRMLVRNDDGTLHETDHVVERLNRMLYELTPSHQFMTFFFGLLDTREMTLTFTNAGHPPPLLMRPHGNVELGSHGLLMGVVDEATYDRTTIALNDGDLFAFFSDGITEAAGEGKRQFRSEGVAGAMRERMQLPVREILSGIWSDCDNHAIGSKGDDRTLLVIRVGRAGTSETSSASSHSLALANADH